MPVENDFLPIAAEPGALVDAQSAFVGATYQTVGFQPGVTLPSQFNKAFRQGSMGMAVLAAFICSVLNVSCLDSGYSSGAAQVAALLAQFNNALTTFIGNAVAWATPGTIGSTTPNTGAFTTLTANTPASTDNSTKVATTQWCFAGFAVSISATAPGSVSYIKFPTWLGGFIAQWGCVTASTPVTVTFALGAAFTVAPAVTASAVGRSCDFTTAPTTAGFSVEAAGSTSVYWQALGK